MDPLTQGLLGAAVTQATWTHRVGKRAWLLGAISGMAADLDVFIRSSDPMVALQYHRHFTHSLAFIPIGAALSALPWLVRSRHRADYKNILGATAIGYATHALLDAFTSYGTQLYWPFSNARVAWNWIAIVDPIFTITVAVGVVLSARRVAARPAAVACLLAGLYLGWGGVQHHRALEAGRAWAQRRGDEIERIEAFPMIATNVVWRVVYESADGRGHLARVRAPWLSPTELTPGDTVALLREDDLDPAVRDDPGAREAFSTFRWFADGWIARTPDDPSLIGDQRYSMRTASAQPLWGIRLRPGTDPPVSMVQNRGDPRELASRLWREIVGARSPD